MTGNTPVTIRDPLWDTIRLDPVAARIVDSAPFQRLRRIRQLGHAHLVYPGASHTRFDHALGVYHLAGRALSVMRERGALSGTGPAEQVLIPLAGLLHDIGHYPYSHALEELETGRIPGHHESIASRFVEDGPIAAALADVAPDAAGRVAALICGRSSNPLQGLVSGSLDLDKIEYLKRDARFCGVPYGEVDVDRLLHALAVAADPDTGRPELAVHEKGVAALESLLFAKYQMFRNVYWHHAVRAATVLYKRIASDALDAGLLAPDDLVGETDEGVLFRIVRSAETAGTELAQRIVDWISDLRGRRLPKRASEVVAADLGTVGVAGWLETESSLKRRVEDRLSSELDLSAGSVYLDYPEKSAMFALDLLVVRRDGQVLRVGPAGQAGLIGLPRIADELYRSARVLRLFTHGARRQVDAAALAGLACMGAQDVVGRLESPDPLLAS